MEQEISENKGFRSTRQLQETLGNVAYQLWVLQVVGSNPAAPTNQPIDSSAAILTFRP
jgi:hypothetical protein